MTPQDAFEVYYPSIQNSEASDVVKIRDEYLADDGVNPECLAEKSGRYVFPTIEVGREASGQPLPETVFVYQPKSEEA